MNPKLVKIALYLTVPCAFSAWAQGVNDANNPGRLASQYSGAGILGALSDVPSGWLVSGPEALQYRGEAGFNEAPALRPRAAITQIVILRPEPGVDMKVKAPFAIEVQFKAQPDTPIDPATFKALYGAFKVDITNRITQYVKVTQEGFTLDNAKIPVGKHRLTLQVFDEKQRIAERELRVEVE
jgi:hypothetical protein